MNLGFPSLIRIAFTFLSFPYFLLKEILGELLFVVVQIRLRHLFKFWVCFSGLFQLYFIYPTPLKFGR